MQPTSSSAANSAVSVLSGYSLGNWGKYPKEYNPAIHGRYDPANFYGKADTPFGEVKLGELPAWIARRKMGPISLAQMMGRAYWRWQHNYVFPRKAGIAPFFQVVCGAMVIFYVMNYPKLKHHGRYKYH